MATFKTSKWMGVQRDLDIKSKAEISDLMISKKPPDLSIKRIPISARKDLKINLCHFMYTKIEFTLSPQDKIITYISDQNFLPFRQEGELFTVYWLSLKTEIFCQ